MQIMPTTADHLRLARDDMFDPELNVAAASRLIVELTRAFSDIHDRQEQRCFVLASYNAGQGHIRDAMRLARRDGKNAQRWADVKTYVLLLSQPEYYRDTLVTCGYMRGQETADYVDMIMQRYKKYIRSAK
jgi:membrane-bound lytic murein transglycosylase F